MTNPIEKLMKSRAFRQLVMDSEAQDLSAQVKKRRAWAAELRELHATREKRLAPLRAKHEKLEAARVVAEKAVQEARRLAREAFQELSALDHSIERAVRVLEGELRESASEAFQQYRAELFDTWDLARSDRDNIFQIRVRDLTIEGRTAVSKLLFEAGKHAEDVMPLDADIIDAEAAIAEHRQQLATQIAEICRRHDRYEAGKAADRLREQEVQRRVLEQDLAFRRRRGCPEDVLEEYRREQEELHGLTPVTAPE